MTHERAELARTIASLVSHELLADLNILQGCSHDSESDRLVFPATDDRPDITVALPLALNDRPDLLRDLVENDLVSVVLQRGGEEPSQRSIVLGDQNASHAAQVAGAADRLHKLSPATSKLLKGLAGREFPS